jgi:hypothetical protein
MQTQRLLLSVWISKKENLISKVNQKKKKKKVFTVVNSEYAKVGDYN